MKYCETDLVIYVITQYPREMTLLSGDVCQNSPIISSEIWSEYKLTFRTASIQSTTNRTKTAPFTIFFLILHFTQVYITTWRKKKLQSVTKLQLGWTFSLTTVYYRHLTEQSYCHHYILLYRHSLWCFNCFLISFETSVWDAMNIYQNLAGSNGSMSLRNDFVTLFRLI